MFEFHVKTKSETENVLFHSLDGSNVISWYTAAHTATQAGILILWQCMYGTAVVLCEAARLSVELTDELADFNVDSDWARF